MTFRSNFVQQIETRGSSEERQFIARWRREIDGFLGTFGDDLLARRCLLTFELSRNLELGLTVRPAVTPCPTIALGARRWLKEPIRTLAEQAAGANLDCQLSLHLSPVACRHTLHLDNRATTGFPLQQHYGYAPPPVPLATIHSWQLGDGISFWLSSKQAPRLQSALGEARAGVEQRFRVTLDTQPAEMLEQYTWNKDQGWGLVRSGLALYDVPAEQAARLLSGSGLKHFRYLAPYRPYRLLAVVFDRSGQFEKYVLLP